jgi:hypothetical protein
MRAMRAWPALLALLAAGCGGGTAAAPTVTAPEPPTTTAAATTTEAATTATATTTTTATTTAPPATTVQRAELKFPATTPDEVLALAGQRPTGVASYRVTVTGGDTTAGVSYGVELASDDSRARIHQTQDTGQTWIGLDLASNGITFVCTQPTGGALACKDGDADGSGAKVARDIAQVLGNEFVANVFSPIVAQGSGVSVAGDNQATVPVSCMAAAAGRLCVSRSGFMTEISTAGVSALAERVTTDVSAADLDQPQPQ